MSDASPPTMDHYANDESQAKWTILGLSGASIVAVVLIMLAIMSARSCS